ncbi:MAG: succinate dehydrogenase/fumarate reductase, flavoprotein subunit [Holophagaceae bacterium]|nr:succinate dehydrogenase/fumarate reductase, flavoprotein subunit [Holophagaceae bacterium]
MKQLETDVIVVAAGLSGLAAAISAAENGAQVIAFEKASTTGGAANMGMGPLGIGSHIQKHQMVSLTPFEAFRKHMAFTHWNVDARLVRDYYMKSGDTIHWLEEMGVEFFAVSPAYAAPETMKPYATSEATWHIVKPEGGGLPGPRAAGAMMKKMTERAEELGVEIRLETPVKKILVEDGKAVGVIAVDKNGEEIEARAKAVIIATGGFGANPQMIKEQIGFEWGKNLFSFAIPGMAGEGIKMAWEAGAGKTPMTIELMYQIPDNMAHFALEGAFRQPCLWVNKLGQRFMNEDGIPNTTFTGNAIVAQPDHVAYSIFDAKLLKHYKRNGPDIQSHVHPPDMYKQFDAAMKAAAEEGYAHVCEADSLEELAEKMGIDKEGLLKTVEEYNEDCANHYDSLYDKDRAFLQPISTPKFYACRNYPGGYGTLGGIRINYKTEVMTDDHQVISGLYAVGVDACNIYGHTYPFILPGNTMGFCLNSGRIAGENAAEFINE